MATLQPISLASPIRIVVVDADRRVRESLSALLGSDDRLEVVGRAGLPAAALELIEARLPDLVVIDPRLPDVDAGLALIGVMKSRWPAMRVLAMSWADELEGSCRCAGVDGFLAKSDSPAEFVEAIVRLGTAADRTVPSGARRLGAPGGEEATVLLDGRHDAQTHSPAVDSKAERLDRYAAPAAPLSVSPER